LSRSTLLYYDHIGLLQPAFRTESGYRIYSQTECERLEQICAFREAGINLSDIRAMLNQQETSSVRILKKRLGHIQREIRILHRQQRYIVHLLGCSDVLNEFPVLTKEKWISILVASGLDETGMNQWHYEFEKSAPEAHHAFLESLGLSEDEILEVRNGLSDEAGR